MFLFFSAQTAQEMRRKGMYLKYIFLLSNTKKTSCAAFHVCTKAWAERAGQARRDQLSPRRNTLKYRRVFLTNQNNVILHYRRSLGSYVAIITISVRGGVGFVLCLVPVLVKLCDVRRGCFLIRFWLFLGRSGDL